MDKLEQSASMLEAEHENYEQLDKDRVVATTQYHEAYERYIQCRHLILKELHALSQAGQLALFRIRRALTEIEEVNKPAGLSSP
ncbi:hypothetical protein [Variovorax sp. E3]|uniref:hypothetical protein n=1 Tax=Variovorax sp. E3 TaxID=1914993 RepID=UPI0018DE8871|nr:hypothetical protein [Variovorax sp. E3]